MVSNKYTKITNLKHSETSLNPNKRKFGQSEDMDGDQEGLLPDRGLKVSGLNWTSSSSNNNNNNIDNGHNFNPNFQSSSNLLASNSPFQSLSNSRRNNLLIVIMTIVLTTCLLVYLYLNMQALNGNSMLDRTDNSVDGGDNLGINDKSKPLSRRRPILDEETIFSDSGPSMIRLSDLLAHCIVALKVAGRDIVSSSLKHNDKLENVSSKGLTREGANDIVTGADMRSHKTIVGTIKDSFPRLRIVSEEDETKGYEDILSPNNNMRLPIDRSQFAKLLQVELNEIQRLHIDWGSLIALDQTLVWIDPLDATKEYSENLTDYVTLMACIVHKSQPIAGIIYKPFTNRSFWSIKDQPSEKHHYSTDLSSILSSRTRQLDEYSELNNEKLRVIVSRSHAGDVKDVLYKYYNDTVDVISSGGSGFKTVELLAGRADVYVHLTHIKKWDICAPNAILNSLDNGAKFTDRNGRPITYGNKLEKVVENGLIASLNPELHLQMVNHLSTDDSGKN